MHDLPIHQTQAQVGKGPDYIDYEVYLRPTSDFKAYIASKGQWLVVLSPQSLAQDVMVIHQEALATVSMIWYLLTKKNADKFVDGS